MSKVASRSDKQGKPDSRQKRDPASQPPPPPRGEQPALFKSAPHFACFTTRLSCLSNKPRDTSARRDARRHVFLQPGLSAALTAHRSKLLSRSRPEAGLWQWCQLTSLPKAGSEQGACTLGRWPVMVQLMEQNDTHQQREPVAPCKHPHRPLQSCREHHGWASQEAW